MNNPVPLLIILLLALLGLGSWFFHSLACEGCVNYGGISETIAPIAKEKFAYPLTIKDGGKLNATDVDDNLRFNRSGFEHLLPISTGVNGVFKKAAAYLNANKNRTINITGLYGKDEENTSLSSTLGLGRANDVKTILTKLGVDAKQIKLGDRLYDQLSYNDKGVTYGAINYSFEESVAEAKADDRLAAIEKDFKARPLILYFQTNSSRVNLSQAERKRFDDLNYYLSRKPNAKVKSVGHTDNVGNRASNINLSRNRADFAAGVLASNGIARNRINIDAKGPDRPIATNGTTAGKAKNRRVEISLQ
jgi:outer membrane protein OmpA-like peptidoglycan-associated protein